MKNTSFQQYRTIDLCIWVVILVVFETVTNLAAARWFPNELYIISQTVAVLCIVMMRWGAFAAVHAVVGGCVFCMVSGGSVPQFVIYSMGNCFALLALLLFKVFGKEKMRGRVTLSILFAVTAFCGAQVGRWLVSLVFGAAVDSIIGFFAADSLSLLYAVVVVLIARRVDGLFEDQKNYLIRTESERRREQAEE